MITNQQLAELIQDKLNGEYDSEAKEYSNIHKYGLDAFSPNMRYEFRIFANDGEYSRAENRNALGGAEVTNTVTQYINGVLKTPNGAAVEGASAETYNAAIEAQIELLIPNCDDTATFQNEDGTDAVTVSLQNAVSLLVNQVLGLPTSDYESGLRLPTSDYESGDDGTMYYVGARYNHASVGERRHRTQAGLSVILTLYMTFAVVALGVSSREIELTIGGEQVYFNRISISRTSTQENNVSATPSGTALAPEYGIARARTTATQLVIGFSAPVRPTALNEALVRYILLGEVMLLPVTLSIPTKRNEAGVLERVTGNYTMTFAEGGVAGEENLNAAYDIRLVEEMTEEQSG